MKLIKAHVTNYRSIEDSNEFEIGDLTCLVGKNEAGKTSLINAIRGVNPFDGFKYDKVKDYPRRFYTRFNERHEDGESVVAICTYRLEQKELSEIAKVFGDSALKSDLFVASHGFGFEKWRWDLKIDHKACLEHVIAAHGLDAIEKGALSTAVNCPTAIAAIKTLPQKSEKLTALLKQLEGYAEGFWTGIVKHIKPPKFFYTSHFDRMSGKISINQLNQDKAINQVKPGDKIFLDFLAYAGTTIEELQNTKNSEELKAKLEAASNDITDEIFKFWSQNHALEIKLDVGEGKPEDEAPYTNGTIVTIRIYNRNHKATVPLSERSAGFIWFFSFLSQFKQLQKTAGNAVLLLDEPGLTLHGKAQSDLLKYMHERLLPNHQVIYTTHSPFLIPPTRMDAVRIVEDLIEAPNSARPIVHGTKVSSDVMRVDKDTLFPLQGVLGYEISQSLFIGQNTLLVEGPSDIVFLQVVSEALRKRGRTFKDERWTICPSGGIDKIFPFVSLFSGNNLNIAVLTDIATGDKAKLERLRKSEILKAGQLFTAADFANQIEADIEDLIHPALYARVLNDAFELPAALRLTEATLLAADQSVRLVKKAEAAFRTMGTGAREFNHYTPAEFLMRNPTLLDGQAAEIEATLAKFEPVFVALNKCLPPK